ncbi:MAG: hypothetical protein WAL07_09180 [Exiguobacterium chiriqhucha]
MAANASMNASASGKSSGPSVTEFANEKAHCLSGGMNVSLISEFR